MATLACYLLLWQLLTTRFLLPTYFYGRLIEILALLLFAALAFITPMKFEKMGIFSPRSVTFRSLAMGAVVSLAFVLALLVLRLSTGADLLFSLRLKGDVSRMTYFLVAPFQEILAKSVMYYSFELVFEEKHPRLANLMSALTFAAFHVVYGIRMMCLAMALSLITGWIFRQERSVWGPALAHFCLGFFPACFGF